MRHPACLTLLIALLLSFQTAVAGEHLHLSEEAGTECMVCSNLGSDEVSTASAIKQFFLKPWIPEAFKRPRPRCVESRQARSRSPPLPL